MENHVGSENSHHKATTNDGSSSGGSPKKTSSSHHSPSKNHDGLVKNHHSQPRENSSPSKSSPSIPKHKADRSKEGGSVKHKDGSVKHKDPHLKHKDPNLKHRDHSSKPKDHSSKSRDPNVKYKEQKDPNRPRDSTGKPKDPSGKSKDPSMKSSGDASGKPKESSMRPKDPSLKSRDPSIKSKDPSARPKDSSMKSKDSKDPSMRNKDPALKHRDPSAKLKDTTAKPNGSNSKPDVSSSKSSPSPRPSDPNKPRPKDPNKKLKEGYVRMKDGTIRKTSSSSKDPKRHSSSSKGEKPNQADPKDVKKEKRPDGGIKKEGSREGHSVKHPDAPHKPRDGQVKVKSEKTDSHKSKTVSPPVKVKTENGTDKSPRHAEVVKEEPQSDEDEMPLNQRLHESVKRPLEDSEDDEPLTARIEKVKKKRKSESDEDFAPKQPKKRKKDTEDEDFDEKPLKKKKKDDSKKKKKDKKGTGSGKEEKPTKKKKKKEEEVEVWKWWEEEPLPEGVRWRFLEHKGPVFAPPYERLPKNVKFYYDGKHIVLDDDAEEVAGFYARMLDHDYTTKEIFNKNFFKDWRKVMNKEEQALITDLKKCDFTRMHKYFLEQAEIRKSRTKEEKQALKETNEKLMAEYGFCTIDGHKEKIGNFKIEPPGLFRGRGDHPKMGMLKKRIQPEQIIINCSKDSVVPKAPEGHKWRSVIHDDSVTWLVSWTENIQGSNKYIMLNPSSRLKGEKDWMKYETARKLKSCVDRIRDDYRQDWKSKEMRIRQRAVALYFIDKLALRAGNEKDEGESADTVGCCSLRVEHIKLHEQDNGQEFVVEFDFLGKDSIRYQNKVAVEKRVFKNLQLFVENKQGDDDLFDRLNTSILNKYLQDLMEGLTAKVFRTYNASITLQNQLKALTVPEDSIPSKILAYNRANRAVAVLCNHQRAAPKTFDKQMANLKEKVKNKMTAIKDAKKDLKSVKQEFKKSGNDKMKALVERKKKAVERLEEQLCKLEMQATDKEENKEIALGTSKLNYLDPRISVAWCKKWEVPMEKVYNRTQRDKFRWAIDMADSDYVF